MNDSGILVLESADATFEHEVFEEPEAPKKDEKAKMPDMPDIDKSTLDKIKDKFGSFFNGEDTDGKTAEQVLEELGKAAKEKKDAEGAAGDEATEEEATGSEEPAAEEKPAEEEAPKEEEPKAEEPAAEDAKAEEPKEGEAEPAAEVIKNHEDKF